MLTHASASNSPVNSRSRGWLGLLAFEDERQVGMTPNDEVLDRAHGANAAHLPPAIRDLVRFLRMTGWRRGEGVGLLWSQVDWDDDEYPGAHDEPIPGPHACVRIGEADTKGGDSRTFPIADAPELRALILERRKVRDGLRVFHRNGKPIGDFRKVWAKACASAGRTGRLVHDLRRTAARDFRRAGVSEGQIMKLCGWKTRDMFDRYNIIDAADLTRAVRRRFGEPGNDSEANGKQSGRERRRQVAKWLQHNTCPCSSDG